MESHLSYFVHVAISITVFYLAYILLFRKEKIFLFNRLYLILSMIVSFIIPLITFTEQKIITETIMPVQLLQATVSTQFETVPYTSPGLNWQQILGILFISGFVFFLTVLITGHLKVWLIVRNASKKTIADHFVRITNKNVPPFTYFSKLIIPSAILDSPHLQSVIHHEQIHAKGQHCIDLCLAEFLFLFQWFNPFAWLMKKAIKENLEFLTDNEAIDHIDKQEYQLSMVSLASKNTFYTFPSISNQSQLKKRIIMIKKNTTNRFPWIKSLIIIPILSILTVTLSGREIQVIYQTSEIKEAVYVGQQNDVNNVVNELNNDATINVADTNVTDPVIIKDKKISGKVIDKDGKAIIGVSITVKGSTIGTITDMNGAFSLSNISNNNVLSFSMIGYDKTEFDFQHLSNSLKSKSVNNETYAITLDSIFVQMEKSTSNTASKDATLTNDEIFSFAAGSSLPIGDNPLYVIDGKKYTSDEFNLIRIKSDDIESIEILSWHVAEKHYGEDAVNGAIIIKTKKTHIYANSVTFSQSDDPMVIVDDIINMTEESVSVSHSQSDVPMFIVDGKKYKPGEFNTKELDPKNIETMEVLHRKDATDKYGEDAKNGVVIIKTKKNKPTTVNISPLTDIPLIIIDGKKYSSAEFDLRSIDPDDIESISILKDNSGESIYGEDAKNGVVLVTTK